MSDSTNCKPSRTACLHTSHPSQPSLSSRPSFSAEGDTDSFPRPPGVLEATDHAMGEYVLIQQMASVQHLARELAHDFRNMLLNIAGLVLQMEKAEPTEVVTGKAQAIRSVLSNLIEMDLEYCRAHGNARPGGFAVLRVEDQGTGIPPEVLPRIFEPMFSTKTTTSCREGCKRGWGLATVYALVTSCGGWIDVETCPGIGSRFEVFFPLDHRMDIPDAG